MEERPIRQQNILNVYTVVTGDYEALNDKGHFERGVENWQVRYFCFTDNPLLTSTEWQIVVMPRSEDSQLLSRRVKMLASQEFETGSFACYKDNNVTLTGSVTDFVKTQDIHSELFIFQHNKRSYVIQEFIACEVFEKDSPRRIRSHFERYLKSSEPFLFSNLYWGGLFVFRVNSSTRNFLLTWYKEFEAGARRDQLSLPKALALSKIKYTVIEGSITNGAWHRWPDSLNRRVPTIPKSFFGKNLARINWLLRFIIIGSWYYFKIGESMLMRRVNSN